MIRKNTLGSARAETAGRRVRRIVAGAFAAATLLLPLGAWGMDSTPRPAPGAAGKLLPLPPVPYLESMRWMSWKPNVPVFRTDILLWPDQPGLLRLPSEYERSFPRVS